MNNFRTLGTMVFGIGSLASFLVLPSARAQGPLAPPGAPAPTMISLSQIEPRTPISSIPYMITNAGAYYLTTNVTVNGNEGIEIAARDVTVDLNGFTISSTTPFAFGTAIFMLSGAGDVAIYNGHIVSGVTNDGSGNFSGTGFAYGIVTLSHLTNCRVSGVTVVGCLNEGIDLGLEDSTVVESCTVSTAGSLGIAASVVKGCTATFCGDTGILADQATDCYGDAQGVGVQAAGSQNCIAYARGNGGRAIYGQTAVNCSGTSSGSFGYGVSTYTAENCWCYSFGDGGVGLSATVAKNCYASARRAGILLSNRGNVSGCSASAGVGINASDDCSIKDCTVSQCSTNGISTGVGCIVQGCTANGCSLYGIVVGTNSTIKDCIAKDNGGDGIRVTNYCQVVGNTCLNNGAPGDATKAGIHIVGSNCRVSDNHAVNNKFRGFLIDAAGHRNVVIRNTAKDNVGLDFDLNGAGDNNYGQVIPTPGANFTNSNPWANIAF